LFDIAVTLDPHADRHALARTDQAGHDRHVIAEHAMKHERLVALIDQRCDMAAIDRLMNIGELILRAQPVQVLAEGFTFVH
jgi:hypothetical protein